MAADPIIYCLDNVSDYHEFEKFFCALLSSQALYPEIDPMGGTNDGGRDAIIRDYGSDEIIAFAFSVNKSWFAKLKHDSKRLFEKQAKIKKIVFACTTSLSANDKDKAYDYIESSYSWRLDLFDQTRLRAILVQAGSSLIKSHPSIFTPSFFLPPTAIPAVMPASGNLEYAQQYLNQHAALFSAVASSTEDLAVEINRDMYAWMGWLVRNQETAELTCYDLTTLNALTTLQRALAKVYGVISDEHYIAPHPESWRIKFDNRERADINVQAILASKKVDILRHLNEFRIALQDFATLSKKAPSGLHKCPNFRKDLML